MSVREERIICCRRDSWKNSWAHISDKGVAYNVILTGIAVGRVSEDGAKRFLEDAVRIGHTVEVEGEVCGREQVVANCGRGQENVYCTLVPDDP